MGNDIIGAVIAFVVGVGISVINYLLSAFVLKKHADKYAFTIVFRQFIQIAYLVVLYIAGGYTPWNVYYLLIGGVLGVTVPMIFFTNKLFALLQ